MFHIAPKYYCLTLTLELLISSLTKEVMMTILNLMQSYASMTSDDMPSGSCTPKTTIPIIDESDYQEQLIVPKPPKRLCYPVDLLLDDADGRQKEQQNMQQNSKKA